MIDWNTSNVKPVVNFADVHDSSAQCSARVLVRVTSPNDVFWGCAFARYFHMSNDWVVEGYHGEYKVTHWTSLNEPSTACFSPVDNSNKE